MDAIIAKLRQAYKEIEQNKSFLEENIKVFLVRDIFLEGMGYDISISKCVFEQKKADTFADIVLKIDDKIEFIIETKSYGHEIKDSDIYQLAKYISKRGVEYGILTNGKDYLLINTNIKAETNIGNDMLRHQIVFWFNIFDSKSKQYSHHDFFRFLSKEALFDTKITNYYRDIAQFKALKYPENSHSWYNYKSTLYRFFEFYSNKRGKYCSRILEEINISDFEDYIEYKKEHSLNDNLVISDSTIRNNYSHLSSMLNTLSESEHFGGISSTHFDKGREENLADIISGLSSRNSEVVDNNTFAQAVAYFLEKSKGGKGIRDLAIFLLCCCYGMERPKIQKLQWADLKFKESTIDIDGRVLPLNQLLKSCLEKIKNEQEKTKIKTKYVFVVLYSGKYKNISTAVINNVFNQLIDISSDEKWRGFSPQYVRQSLIKQLFDFGFTIDGIMYITGLPIENVANYIPTEKIIGRYKKLKSKPLSALSQIFGNILENSVE